jgi:hypothetical protein
MKVAYDGYQIVITFEKLVAIKSSCIALKGSLINVKEFQNLRSFGNNGINEF